MASEARRPPSGPRLFPPLLLPLLLLLVGAARGNEGSLAGSCSCEAHDRPPPLLTEFSGRLQFCDTCQGFLRFHFPKRKVCLLSQLPWVLDQGNALCSPGGQEEGVRRAGAHGEHHPPAPTSQIVAATWTSLGSAGVSPDRSLETPRRVVAGPPEKAGSPPPPGVDAAARGVGQTPKGEDPPPAPAATAPVLALLSLILALVGVTVFLVCRRKRRQHGGSWADQAPRLSSSEQEEERLWLPEKRPDAAAPAHPGSGLKEPVP